MITPEEEKARGQQLSTLYPTPKPASELGPKLQHVQKTNWGMVVKQGVLLGGVTAIAFALIAFFLRIAFNSVGDLQQGSILFMVFFLLVVLIVLGGARTVYRQLGVIVVYSTGVFWSGVSAAFGASCVLFGLLLGSSRPSLGDFWIKLAVAAIGIIIATTAVMLIVAKLLEKNKLKY